MGGVVSWPYFSLMQNFVPSVHTSLSKIMLHPAPGEQFDLKVLVLDEMFNSQPRTLKVQVRNCTL